MFVKLIVLILALGSTGVGVLSVRQSRLVASNEMTQARMRSRDLDRRSMELHAQIAASITPDQIRAMLGDEIDSDMIDQTQRRIDLLDPYEPDASNDEPTDDTSTALGDIEPQYWTLDDGTRVYVLDSED